ncbi:MAG: AgmX/PglI C-terminal domain-containing protein [Bdellovibrionaceae bacterium]|nr:AgmX/PglI C-terminal domain-containing protein [Pseudobdellovibrionaceae bacterium]MDW8189421.1 AgmX/PglI C-terminal domain-containing protein [Pseudobdellovibrionaceae bacterium]
MLVLKDRENKVIRVFTGEVSRGVVFYDRLLKRLSVRDSRLFERMVFKESNRLNRFLLIKEFELSELIKSPLSLGLLGTLEFVSLNHRDFLIDTRFFALDSNERRSAVVLSVISVLAFCILFIIFKVLPREISPNLEEEIQAKLVEMRKLNKDTKPQVVVPHVQIVNKRSVPVTVVNKDVSSASSMKRVGVLAVLGELQRGSKVPGINLGSVNVTSGSGLGGSLGSGGVQSQIYAKGMIAAPLGLAQRLEGAGGYGTKGSGGGSGGYGNISIVGSRGRSSLGVGGSGLGYQSGGAGLNENQIRAVIEQNSGQVRYCYEQALLRNPELAGRVTINFIINAKGFVTEASVGFSNLNNHDVEQCIVDKLKMWRFPSPEGGVDVKVSYPFTLKRSSQG